MICRPTTPELAKALRRRKIAVVDLNDRYGYLGLPRITSDMCAIGSMATEHLLERGFRHIAYCGFQNEMWSVERLEGVKEALSPTAVLCGVFESPWQGLREHVWEQERDEICQWLQTLPRPLGIVACNDVRGHHVLDACRALNIAVPEEIAVIGVDNAETFCELCDPPLSSVLPHAERIGFEAASLLSRLMQGEAASAQELLVEPQQVVTRQSSDMLAIEDPAMAGAVRFIRENVCQRISVEDVATRASLSRAALERGFRRYLGHSPQEEIRRLRLRRVKQLLSETDWPLARIAEETGFEHPEYMMVQFKRLVGKTPSQWRRNQNGTASSIG